MRSTVSGAASTTRTRDIRITNAALYQLSYGGTATPYSVRITLPQESINRPVKGGVRWFSAFAPVSGPQNQKPPVRPSIAVLVIALTVSTQAVHAPVEHFPNLSFYSCCQRSR